MDFLFEINNNITVFEVGLLLLCNATANLFNKPRLAILTNLAFTIYWGFFLNFEALFSTGQTSEYSFIFFIFALVVIIFSILGITRDEDACDDD
jgi:membrane-bound acyltransferase YfiQ involved in biofilm formation